MNKNIVSVGIIILLILCVGEGYFIYKEHAAKLAALSMLASQNQKPKMTQPSRPKPMLVMKGQTFADNPLSKKAYLIAPITGDWSADAKKALTGWDVKTLNNSDWSLQVILSPHEVGDIQQQFTVKQGYKLYFIEMTLVDDSATNGDQNRGDDIGVLVDQNGIVQ